MAMEAMAAAFVEAGFEVAVPCLPGHGTSVADLAMTGWSDWIGAASDELADIRPAERPVVVVGQSMGASLAVWLAAAHPELAGIVAINTPVLPPPADVAELIEEMLAVGEELVPAGPPDLADPSAIDVAYDETPLRALQSFHRGLEELAPRLGEVRVPVLVVASRQDHTIDPASSDVLAASVAGPVTRLELERSYHVATLDLDAPLLRERTVAFALDVCARAVGDAG